MGEHDVVAWSFCDEYGLCGSGYLCPDCVARLCGNLDTLAGLVLCPKYGHISPVLKAQRFMVKEDARCSECGRLIWG